MCVRTNVNREHFDRHNYIIDQNIRFKCVRYVQNLKAESNQKTTYMTSYLFNFIFT